APRSDPPADCRSAVRPRGLHRHVRHALLRQPVGQRQDVTSHRPEAAHLLSYLPIAEHAANACSDGLLVDIDSTDPLIDHFHLALPFRARSKGRRRSRDSASRAPAKTGATISGSKRRPGQTKVRARGTKVRTTSCFGAPTTSPTMPTRFSP